VPLISPIPPFKLERYFARWEFVAPYNLCASDVEGHSLRDLLALADPETRVLWDGLTLGYTESAGHPLVRDEIAKLYTSVARDEVLCFAGAEEAIYITMRVLVGPGDHVIVTWPGYQSLFQVAQTIGAEVSLLSLRPVGEAWTIDLDELRGMIRSNTKVIVTNFPHNPTGATLARREWEQVVQLARNAGCYLFSDEVYRFLEYDEADRLPAAVDRYEKAVSLGVMSKPFGLAGLRIGWMATRDHELLTQIAAYKDYTTICNSAPSEILALIGLRAKEQVLARCLGIIQTNLTVLDAFMRDHAEAFEWIGPRAGSIAFPKWRGQMPIEEFTDALVQAEGVILLPATVFDYPDNHFRIGLGRMNMTESLERLSRFVRQHFQG
jgi:aspartate/methionine/tyrosine aminotransferase